MPSSSFAITAIIIGVLSALVLHSVHWRPHPVGQTVLFDVGLLVLVAAVVVLIYEARHS
jgi:hypothetical protein